MGVGDVDCREMRSELLVLAGRFLGEVGEAVLPGLTALCWSCSVGRRGILWGTADLGDLLAAHLTAALWKVYSAFCWRFIPFHPRREPLGAHFFFSFGFE